MVTNELVVRTPHFPQKVLSRSLLPLAYLRKVQLMVRHFLRCLRRISAQTGRFAFGEFPAVTSIHETRSRSDRFFHLGNLKF
jgi:hypothetical protein